MTAIDVGSAAGARPTRGGDTDQRGRVLVLACGALARELKAVVRSTGFEHLGIECLPGDLHNHPDRIPAAIEARLDAVGDRYDRVLIGYADCGTGGRLDELCRRRGIERLPGAHCYELYAGPERFAAMSADEPGTFYLTDYLAKHFDRLVYEPLGLDRHPELHEAYFGRYRRVVHLAQVDDPAIRARAEAAAERLGLDFEHRVTGYGGLGQAVVELGAASR